MPFIRYFILDCIEQVLSIEEGPPGISREQSISLRKKGTLVKSLWGSREKCPRTHGNTDPHWENLIEVALLKWLRRE
jgi:hypothetical protein